MREGQELCSQARTERGDCCVSTRNNPPHMRSSKNRAAINALTMIIPHQLVQDRTHSQQPLPILPISWKSHGFHAILSQQRLSNTGTTSHYNTLHTKCLQRAVISTHYTKQYTQAYDVQLSALQTQIYTNNCSNNNL